MAVVTQPQTALDERVVEDAELEAALEEREQAKAARAKAAKTFESKDEAARVLADKLDDLFDGPVRVGRFVLVERKTTARSVAFDVEAKTRLSIRVAK